MNLIKILKSNFSSLDSIVKPTIVKDFTSALYFDKYKLKLKSCNFSIIEDSTYGGKYIVIIRYVSLFNNILLKYNLLIHQIRDIIEYGNIDNNYFISKKKKLININKILILDKDFNIIKTKIYIPNKHEYLEGLEDTRLIKYNNKIYYMGYKSIDILDHNNICGLPVRLGVQISKLDLNKNRLEDNTYITPNFIEKQEIEKNWVHFTMNNKSYFIYKWDPITITQIDMKKHKLIKYKTLPYNFKNIRGSTNGVIVNNEIWFLVHDKKKSNILFKYYHRFIVFDLNMNLIKFSNEFKFNNKIIEFCLSMINKNNDLLLTYSYNDDHLFLKKYNIDKLNNSLEWHYNIEEYTNYSTEHIIFISILIIFIIMLCAMKT